MVEEEPKLGHWRGGVKTWTGRERYGTESKKKQMDGLAGRLTQTNRETGRQTTMKADQHEGRLT